MKDRIQFVWGVVLIIMGVAFFFRIPVVIERIPAPGPGDSLISHIFIVICMLLISIILIGGGIKKLIRIRRNLIDPSSPDNTGQTDK